MDMATAGHRLIDSNRDETKEIFVMNPNPNNQDKDHRVQKKKVFNLIACLQTFLQGS